MGENKKPTGVIDVCFMKTEHELPQEVRKFFLDILAEHKRKIEAGSRVTVLEAFNIRVDMFCNTATVETQTSSFDRTRHFIEQLLG